MDGPIRVTQDEIDLFHTPARIIICGFSNSGKSYLTNLIIKKYLHKFEEIVCIGSDIAGVKRDDNFQPFSRNLEGNLLVIIDDSILDKNRMLLASSVFTKGRHEKISIILISQTLYPNCPHFRLCALNSTHYLIFRTRDMSQMSRFASTFIQSDKKNDFICLYRKEVLGRKFGFLLLDFCQEFHSPLCIRTDIIDGPERAFLL